MPLNLAQVFALERLRKPSLVPYYHQSGAAISIDLAYQPGEEISGLIGTFQWVDLLPRQHRNDPVAQSSIFNGLWKGLTNRD